MTIDVFNGKLLGGEKIIWSGQPGQGVILSGRDGLMIPFSLFWGGFALFWESRVLSLPRAPIVMKVWGIPFVLIGLYLIFGRFLLDAYIRRRMFYAVTNQRILILRAHPFASFTSLSLERLPELKLTEGKAGQGTICFSPQGGGFGRHGFGGWTPALDSTPKFLSINDAQGVFDKFSALCGRRWRRKEAVLF